MVLFRVFLVLRVSSPLLETCSPDGFAVFRCVSSCFLVLFALGAEDGFFVVFFDFDFADLFCFSDFGGLLHSRFAGGSIGRTRALT